MHAKTEQREEARRMRAGGAPLAAIATALGVAKSSVSVWVRDVPITHSTATGGGSPRSALPAGALPARSLIEWRCGEAKRCSRCRLLLPHEAFNRLGAGRQYYCRECFRAYHADPCAQQRRRTLDADVKRLDRAKAFVVELLRTRPCQDCGEADPVVLEFDHPRDDKLANLGDLIGGGVLERIEKEIRRCDVVCVSCYRRRTAERAGWIRALPEWRAGLARLSPYRRRNIEFIYSHLEQSGCVDCGCSDLVALDFDHEGEKRTMVTRAAWNGNSIAYLRREISTCSVRCGNCHRRRTASVQGSFRWRDAIARRPALELAGDEIATDDGQFGARRPPN